jgi:RHS repeat-associated protein
MKAGDSSISAQYEYGPFGEIIRSTGTIAKANALRFSTKYQDDETDLLYYGYRFYNGGVGKWASRDPAEQRGAGNLHCFAKNSPCTSIDPDGRITVSVVKASAQCCGGAQVFFRFMLDRPAAEEGWIVQMNTADVPWEGCDGILHGSLFNEPHMWEAWHVAANATAPDQSYPDGSHDEVSWDGKNQTTGAGGVDGTLKFFFKSHPGVGDLSDWPVRISSPSSGILPSTRGPPDWWNQPPDNGEATATRSVHTTWDCCCSKNISFLSASPGGVTRVYRGACK